MTAMDLNGVSRVLESLPWFPDASRPIGVLVASSDLDARLLLAHHLEGLGYGVWTASCGSDAYQIAIEHPVVIDVLLCDEDLPEGTVAELYSRLKKRFPGLACCVRATTIQQTRAREAARLGAVILETSEPTNETADLALAHAW